jgi:hypothetical protein
MRYQLNMALGLVPAIALAANTSFSQAMVGQVLEILNYGLTASRRTMSISCLS